MLVLGPLLVPLATAMTLVLLRSGPAARQWVSVGGTGVMLVLALRLVVEVDAAGRLSVVPGDWPLPYGIEFAADRLSAVLVLTTAVLGLAVLVYRRAAKAEGDGFHPLFHGLLASMAGAFLTADLFNLYVWFELMLIAVLGLIALGGERRHLEAAFKYFALNMVGTILLLASVAFLYGATGQLNFAALTEAARQPGVGSAIPVFTTLLALALLLKSAAFPLFFWLPASYHTLPAPSLALIGGLVTKVGVYALLRLFGQVFAGQPSLFYETLGWIAVVTMVSGVLGAAYHWDLRRILAFHIVSQIGYLLLAVALATPAGGAAGLFFMVHNIVAKASLFLIAGLMWRTAGHYDLRRIGGLYPARPLLAAVFLLAAFSLVGIPPSSGFWGKFLLIREAFAQGRYAWGGFALAVGALTLYSMVKIWVEGFWKPHPDEQHPGRATVDHSGPGYAAVLALGGLLLVMGLYPEPFVRYAEAATAGLWPGSAP